MTENDTILVLEASSIRNFDFARLENLRSRCDTAEGKSRIDAIERREYHREEARAGLI